MIQIDMPMPKNCADCCFATADLVNGKITLFCMAPAGKKMYSPDLIGRKTRPEWCPMKEKKAVEPYIAGSGESFETAETWWYECGNCNKPIDPNDKFCRHCGQAIKWE